MDMDPRDLYRAADSMMDQAREMEAEAARLNDVARDLYRESDNVRAQARDIERNMYASQDALRDAEAAINGTRSGRSII
ncbi:MAG: hypothetical protein K0S68_1045 [Candidatus Saccharibacteria bacterium]|jgi:predicted  nucleic acid-binding Zn-ribbon protein|nr:hypothetical protein [Candidatus Saccharibacteria bacterium]